jgi:hypothetical protein
MLLLVRLWFACLALSIGFVHVLLQGVGAALCWVAVARSPHITRGCAAVLPCAVQVLGILTLAGALLLLLPLPLRLGGCLRW